MALQILCAILVSLHIRQISSNDYHCKPGYYGARCTLICPYNCRGRVLNKPICSQTSGICRGGCNNGFYGKRCGKECSPHCLNSTCSQGDGVCTHGCKDNWHGPQCSVPCRNTCHECLRNGLCKSCIKGYWGVFCENKCSLNCKDNACAMRQGGGSECSHGCMYGWKGLNCDTPCEEEHQEPSGQHSPCSEAHKRIPRDTSDDGCFEYKNGKCSCCKTKYGGPNCTSCPKCRKTDCKTMYLCENGYFGSADAPCSKTCSKSCDDGVCNYITGDCVQCSFGTYGSKCEYNCSAGCDGGCSKLDGTCHQCREGYHGSLCELLCSTTCMGGCFQNNGTCVKCVPKKYGDHCERDCSSSCHGALCHKENGACIDGCIRGKYGVNCTGDCSNNCKGSECIQAPNSTPTCIECFDGYWGPYCENSCPVNCLRCGQLQGECVICNQGFTTGANCFSLIPVAVTVIVVIMVLAVIITVIVLIRKRKLHRLCFCVRRMESSQTSQNCPLQSNNESSNTTEDRQTGSSGSQSEASFSSAVETSSLLDNKLQNDAATNGERHHTTSSSAVVEMIDESRQDHSGSVNSAKRVCSQPSERRGKGVRLDGIYSADLEGFHEILEDFSKSREGESHMKTFWSHLGYSEVNIPKSSTRDTVHRMLKTSPNLQGQEMENVIYKIILALRFAGMFQAAEELVNKHQDCLPPQFIDEIRKVQKLNPGTSEPSENITVFQTGCRECEGNRGNYIGC